MADEELRQLVARALSEDIGNGDLTTEATVPSESWARGTIVQKAPGVLFGLDAAEECLRQAGAEGFERLAPEAEWSDDVSREVARVEGPARALLSGERVALNFLGHLSGIATLTARFVGAVDGSGAVILDTRKTIPGLRSLEKAAVAAGGGRNHRMGLDDAILIKENHAAIAGGVGEAVRRARERHPNRPVEAECRSTDEVRQAVEAGAARLLLDNMDPEALRAAVMEAAAVGERPELEASGGVTLANVGAIAASGVDAISVGALTHSAPALDVSMSIESA